MAFKYNVTGYGVSDANRSETELNYGEALTPVQLLRSLTQMLETMEKPRSKEFPEYDIRYTKIVINVQQFLSRGFSA